MAADGRGLMETTINNKFATLSESLYVAERKASEDLRIRNQIRKKMAMREKEDREKDLRDMALQARMGRAGVNEPEVEDFVEEEFETEPIPIPAAARGSSGRQREEIEEPPSSEQGRRSDGGDYYGDGRSRDNDKDRRDDRDRSDRHRSDRDDNERHRGDRDDSKRDDGRTSRGHRDDDRRGGRGDDEERAPQGETNDESVARQQRERLRQDRRKERERDIRLENMKVCYQIM